MGTKLTPGKFDCYANALPDEPMFVLLARDPWAPDLVEEWAVKRMRDIVLGFRPSSDLPMVDEAQRCAKAMKEWRTQNEGNWPRPTSEPKP